MKTLLNYPFTLVNEITLSKNNDGSIQEYFPETLYKKEASLHKYGEGPFCYFSISSDWKNKAGIYAFYADEQLFYIGQCHNLQTRINMGYGSISPRSCYMGGQSTNCKINKVILGYIKEGKKVSLYFHELPNINLIEIELIRNYTPKFNTQHNFSTNKILQVTDKKKKSSPNKTEKTKVKDTIVLYIQTLFEKHRKTGHTQITLRAGDIHREMNLKQKMPSVCQAMYSIMQDKDEVIEKTSSGYGSNVYILYHLYPL